MEWLAALLVRHPERPAAVAAVLLVAWGLNARPNPLWFAALLWLAYALWEWMVTVRTPDADIRVDLLLIWPVVGLATAWAASAVAWRRARRR